MQEFFGHAAFATDCCRLRPPGSIRAPSSVAALGTLAAVVARRRGPYLVADLATLDGQLTDAQSVRGALQTPRIGVFSFRHCSNANVLWVWRRGSHRVSLTLATWA